MDPVDEIKRLYFNATQGTILRDLAKAVALLKTLPDEAARERVAVYMDGLSQMRSEWGVRGPGPGSKPKGTARKGAGGRRQG